MRFELLAILAISVLLIGCVQQAPAATPTPDAMMEKDGGTMEKAGTTDDSSTTEKEGSTIEGAMKEGGSMEEKAGESMEGTAEGAMIEYEGEVLAGGNSKLLDFTKTDYEAAIASDKTAFLYFYANWCPVCRAEFPIAEQAFDELEADGIVGFRVNFKDDQTDEFETALAQEFGVAYQHTKVAIKGGERVLKSPESWDKARYLKELNTLAA